MDMLLFNGNHAAGKGAADIFDIFPVLFVFDEILLSPGGNAQHDRPGKVVLYDSGYCDIMAVDILHHRLIAVHLYDDGSLLSRGFGTFSGGIGNWIRGIRICNSVL